MLFLVFAVLVAPTTAAPIYNAANGHYYEAITVSGGITWTNANIAANNPSLQSHLVTITSQEESDFLVANFPKAMGSESSYGYWIGARQYGNGAFVWVTGEAFVYTNWNPGEPNGSGLPDEGVHFFNYATMGKWNDAGVDTYAFMGYVVEYEGAPVPEPSSFLLVMGAMVFLRMSHKRR